MLVCRCHRVVLALGSNVTGAPRFSPDHCPKGKLEALRDDALKAGARRADLLRVAVASHTPLLAEASRRFGEALAGFRLPDRLPEGVRLLSGIDGDAVFDVSDGRRKLAVQISHTINWAACLDSCRAVHAETYLELGPGHALATMAHEALPQDRIHSLDDFHAPAGIVAWLQS